MWETTPIDLSNSFDFSFTVFPGCIDAGADGMVFTLQPNSITQMGNGGGGIGYQGIPNSLGVELDTYQNGWDPVSDHVAIIRNGDVDHTGPNNLAGPVNALSSGGDIEDCNNHNLRVVWNATVNSLSVYFDGNLRLTYNGNIVSSIFNGNPSVYWGFVSSTGGSMNEQRVCTSSFADFTASNNFEVCVGQALNFTDLSGSDLNQILSRQWDFGDQTTSTVSNPTHSYSVAGTYPVQLRITDPSGCPQTITRNVTVHPQPVLSVSTSSSAICPGDHMQLDAQGANLYTWNPTAGLNVFSGPTVQASPASSTTYTVQGTSIFGCVDTTSVQVIVNPAPALSLTPNQSICLGDTINLLAHGASLYAWTPISGISSTSDSSISAYPSTSVTYTVTGTNSSGCSSTSTVDITVNTLPSVQVPANFSLCFGQTAVVQTSGASTYQWIPSSGLNVSTGSSVTASPAINTTYTVIGTSSSGCSSSNTFTIQVDSIPVLHISADTSICSGSIANLSVVGANLYQWSPSPTFSSATDSLIRVSPSNTTTYTVTGTGMNGCTVSSSVRVSVIPLPALQTITGDTLCEGQSVTLTATGATSYSWQPSGGLNAVNGSTVIATPLASTNYTVTGTQQGCSTESVIIIRINPLPVISVPPPITICLNQSTAIHVSGASTYTWSPSSGLSSSTGSNVTAGPSNSCIYTVTGTSSGCSSTATISVTVAPLLNVGVSPAAPVICLGDTSPVHATGASQFQWFPSAGLSSTNSAAVNASPNSTTTYTVIGSSGACSDTTTFTLTVNPLPIVNVSSPAPICAGDTTLLSATGAVTYSWSPSMYLNSVVGDTVAAFPIGSTIYTVVGSSLGCRDTASVMLTVTPLPVVSVLGSDSICFNASTTLSAYGATLYQWSPAAGLNSISGSSVMASPAATTTYTVSGTANLCSSTKTFTLHVIPLPVLNSSQNVNICEGSGTNLHCTGADQYVWSPSIGLDTTSGSVVFASPSTSQIYTVTGTSNQCSSSTGIQVQVLPRPVVSTDPDTHVCKGSSVSIHAHGATDFEWHPHTGLSADTGSVVLAGPENTTTYTITGIMNGCRDTAQITVGVIPLPDVTVSNDTSICEGDHANLMAAGAAHYSWNPESGLSATSGSHVAATPLTTTMYTVTGESNGCSNVSAVTVNVNPLPVVRFSPGTIAGCKPLSVVFRDSSSTPAGSLYSWLVGDTIVENARTFSYQFKSPGNYSVQLTVTSPQQCSATIRKSAVTVYDFPDAMFAISPEVTTILDPSVHLTDLSSDATEWNWSFGDGNELTGIQHPIHSYGDTGTFLVKLIVKNIHGCPDTITGIVRVNEDYAFYIPNTFSPNGDGVNDIFKPLGMGLHGYELLIFDRWGETVFHSNRAEEGWNGFDSVKGRQCQEGVYVYKLKTQDPSGNYREYAGHITLLY